MRSAGPIHLVGASIPRSGHHFLATLLEAALGDDVRYCEFYSVGDCCRRVPCSRGDTSALVYQKNHDLDLTLDPDLPGVHYVVQYREPVPAVVSDRELFAAVRGGRIADDRDHYLSFLGERAAQYVRFYEKWIRQPRPSAFLIKYEQLIANPAGVLGELLRFCGLEVAQNDIEQAVQRVAPIPVQPPILKHRRDGPFTPRVASKSRYFDPDLLAPYESLVMAQVPELSAGRTFPPADYAGHLLFALFQVHCALLDRRIEDAARLATDAQRRWPDCFRLSQIAGSAWLEMGRPELAVEHLEQAVRLMPYDAAVLVACANAQIAAQHVDRARELAGQLVALAPGDASHRLFHATILLLCGRPAEALQQGVAALEIGVSEPRLLEAFSSVVRRARQAGWGLHAGRLDQAASESG